MAVITFSRQFGSGGDEIAARVAELLDYAIFRDWTFLYGFWRLPFSVLFSPS